MNSIEVSNSTAKIPFLIGVAGGTASGKVCLQPDYKTSSMLCPEHLRSILKKELEIPL